MKWWKGCGTCMCFVLACLVAAACGERPKGEKGAEKAQTPVSGVLLEHFKRWNPQREVIKWAEADLDNDGRRDCIVIYRVAREKNMMRVVLDRGGNFVDTNEVPAPYSDQVIQFRDIDGKPPMEFIVQGAKGAKMGFAVFRVEEGWLTDLFGEGMEDCC
ncbi:Cys-Cys-COOH (seleno)protein SaoC [Syntrophobacter fumaroxidans]|nr:Cys-Cys-COOH (seleno)protein SaoC [Syntrophobacter fumaroxidans]